MVAFKTKRLPVTIDEVALDGSDVRRLLGLEGGVMAHYELAPGHVSVAVRDQTVEEIWYFISGRGEMWRKQGDREEIVSVEAGVCVTIPLGTHFQIRSFGYEGLAAVGVTIPPWPGRKEAIMVQGKWRSTLEEIQEWQSRMEIQELDLLLQDCDPDAIDCEFCKGTGTAEGLSAELAESGSCDCGGLGWIH